MAERQENDDHKVGVRIMRLDPDVPMPKYETPGAAGFDLAANERAEIKPGERVLIGTGLIIETPPGYALVLAPRSSTPKRELSFPHSIGIIDGDYSGPADEVKLQVYNYGKKLAVVEKGDRIAQGMFARVDRANWIEVDSMDDNETRGGFGSTG